MILTRDSDGPPHGWRAYLTDEEIRLLDLAVCFLEPGQVDSLDQRNTLADVGRALIEAVGVLGG